MQLSYENNPAPAMMGMLAEPLAPQLIVSRLCEAAAVVPGVAVMYGTDKTKQAKLATGKDVFAGVAVYSDNLEQKPTGVVYDGTVAGQAEGEMEATMTYQVGQMMPVMQGGVCWVRAGEDVAATLEQAKDHIGHIQIADFPGRHEPGAGSVDWHNMLQLIANSGYRGAIGVECYPSVATSQALQFIREQITAFNKEAV